MKRKIASILASTVILCTSVNPLVYAASRGDAVVNNFSGGFVSEHTSTKVVSANIQNNSNETLYVDFDKGTLPGNFKLLTTNSVGPNQSETVKWELDMLSAPLGQLIDIKVLVKDPGGNLIAERQTSVKVDPISPNDVGKPNLSTITPVDNTFKPDNTVNYVPQAKLEVITNNGINAGVTNQVGLRIKNTGNAPFNQVFAKIELGDKMTLQNASVEQNAGSMATNSEKIVYFPVYVENSHTGGNVPMNFSIRAVDPTGKESSFSVSKYVTVNSGTSLADKLDIVNIRNVDKVSANQDFTLKFVVKNNSSALAKNVKITVEPTAPIVNKTRNIFVSDIEAGGAKEFSVTMFATGSAESQNYPIKITAETQGQDATTITQYSGVFVNGESSKTVPQVIVTNYTYGGSPVVANETFPLSLVLKNTNTSQTVKNVKVSITSEEGVFIPHNTSSSFYIAQIAPGAALTKTIQLMTKPDAQEKTTSVSVDMTYEDSKGNPVSAKDVISVPVIQQRRIEIDEVEQQGPLFVGENGSLSVKYYNMGKNTLNNLIIDAKGDFDFPQSPKTFIGKFDAGKSDTFDFTVVPKKVGESKGTLIFRFEDSNGKVIEIEKPFKATAEEFVPEEPTEPIEPENTGASLGKKVGIGATLAALATGVVVFMKRRKKKMNESLDIDNE